MVIATTQMGQRAGGVGVVVAMAVIVVGGNGVRVFAVREQLVLRKTLTPVIPKVMTSG